MLQWGVTEVHKLAFLTALCHTEIQSRSLRDRSLLSSVDWGPYRLSSVDQGCCRLLSSRFIPLFSHSGPQSLAWTMKENQTLLPWFTDALCQCCQSPPRVWIQKEFREVIFHSILTDIDISVAVPLLFCWGLFNSLAVRYHILEASCKKAMMRQQKEHPTVKFSW